MPVLRLGDKGPAVEVLTAILSPQGITSDHFTTRDDRMVRGFQRRRSIVVDGVVGPVTWSHLTSELVLRLGRG